MSLIMCPRTSFNNPESYCSPELVDMNVTFSRIGRSACISAHCSKSSELGMGRCDAWYAAVMGNFTEVPLNVFSLSKHFSVEGGPLMLTEESITALMYACLCRGNAFQGQYRTYAGVPTDIYILRVELVEFLSSICCTHV